MKNIGNQKAVSEGEEARVMKYCPTMILKRLFALLGGLMGRRNLAAGVGMVDPSNMLRKMMRTQ